MKPFDLLLLAAAMLNIFVGGANWYYGKALLMAFINIAIAALCIYTAITNIMRRRERNENEKDEKSD